MSEIDGNIYIYIYKHDLSLFSHALQNVCLEFNKDILPTDLSGPRLSVPSPNRQEQRAPLCPLGPHQPNPMLPRLRHLMRGKPFPDSLQPRWEVSPTSQLREIDVRMTEKHKQFNFRLFLASRALSSERKGGSGRACRAQSYVGYTTDSCLVMGTINQTRPQLIFPRVAECLSRIQQGYTSYGPLGAPTLCSLAKPTGTESPPVPPRAASAKPDAP